MKKASLDFLMLAEVPIAFKGNRFRPDIINYAMAVLRVAARPAHGRGKAGGTGIGTEAENIVGGYRSMALTPPLPATACEPGV